MFLLADAGSINPSDPSMIILGLGGVVVMYVIMRPLMRRKKDPFAKPFATTSLSQQRSVERQMESLLVELSEMSRQMTAQLDTRAAKLEALIGEADAKIATLERLSRENPTVPQRFVMPATQPTPEPVREPKPEPAAEPEYTIPPGHAEVYRMADDGKSPGQIAGELGRPVGEVELILALRPRV